MNATPPPAPAGKPPFSQVFSWLNSWQFMAFAPFLILAFVSTLSQIVTLGILFLFTLYWCYLTVFICVVAMIWLLFRKKSLAAFWCFCSAVTMFLQISSATLTFHQATTTMSGIAYCVFILTTGSGMFLLHRETCKWRKPS
jgi:hypothetical protein